jgi:hypothetical protein
MRHLSLWGCLKLRMPDRRRLAQERSEVERAAALLGRRAYTSYRYPFLYARLGEKTSPASSDPGRERVIGSDRVRDEQSRMRVG